MAHKQSKIELPDPQRIFFLSFFLFFFFTGKMGLFRNSRELQLGTVNLWCSPAHQESREGRASTRFRRSLGRYFSFFTEVQLLYNIVLVSAVQRSELAIGINISPKTGTDDPVCKVEIEIQM